MRTIFWQKRSSADLDRLYLFLESKNPSAAMQAIATIKESALQLISHPHIGRPMRDGTERRDLLIPFGAGNYVMRYRLDGNAIAILRVWHNREERIH